VRRRHIIDHFGPMPVGESPVKRVEKPALAETDPDVRFLETEELIVICRCAAARRVVAP
jgi:hypothetical protein